MISKLKTLIYSVTFVKQIKNLEEIQQLMGQFQIHSPIMDKTRMAIIIPFA